MHITFPLALSLLLLAAVPPQERVGAKKAPTFVEAIDLAKKAVDGERFGAAITAMQAGILDLQKKQRVAVLAGLPKPEGWTFDDPAHNDNEAFAAGLAAMGMTVSRRYTRGEDRISVEVAANTPMVAMLGALFNNPAIIEADGGELVKYGAHRAILKKTGDKRHELQLLMHDAHLIKVDAQGLDSDALLKVFDQAFVDRMEKPLGR